MSSMWVSNLVRIRAVQAGALALTACLGIFACAGSGTSSTDMAEGSGRVVDVWVDRTPEGGMVTLVGPQAPVFTAYQESNPPRVVVDLAQVSMGEMPGVVSVDDGMVDEVRLEEQPGDMTRIEINLASEANYEVHVGDEGLVVTLVTADATDATTMADGDPWNEQDESWSAQEGEAGEVDPWAASTESDGWSDQGQAAMDAQPATMLESVVAQGVGSGALIHLMADGTVESAVAFTLEDPSRLVLDLPGVKSSVEQQSVEVSSEQVARVRVGAHADKVRVVVDGGSAANSFDGRRVIPVATGLLVALGDGAEIEAAMSEAMGQMPEAATLAVNDVGMIESEISETQPAPELPAAMDETSLDDEMGEVATATGNVMVYGVEFEAQEDQDRVMVLSEEAIDYLVYEPDAETVILSLGGATISPDAEVRIAPETPGSVSLVTAFEQPEVEGTEVRVVMKRAANLQPVISREGAVLIVDFPHTGSTAAVPPVLQGAGMELASRPDPSLGSDSTGAGLIEPMPAAMDMDPMPMGSALPGLPAEAASAEPPAAIDILDEGGLMDGKEYSGRRISLDFKDVDIADVLRLIAEVSDLNVIAGDEVDGKVTIRLVDVPWDQALDVILLTKGLGFARIGNVLRIASADVLAQEEELRLQERRAREKLEDLVVKLQPVNYADVKDVSKMVKELLTPRGSVNTDSRTNTLIIKDIASVIDEATALVKAVDTMTPQVMIEAKIVEASLDFSRELGSLWTFGTNPLTESTLGGRDYVFQQGADDGIADGLGNQVIFGNPITAGPTGLLGLAASVIDEKFNFEVELQAAEVNGDGKVVSSPRVVTLDNSTATIEQGVSIPFQTFTNGDAALEFVDAVLKLDVTPHITADGSIIMEIEVSRNAPDDSVFTLTGSPAISKNQVETETLVKDGQTLVLGGIYVVDRSERESRVPYLSKLPFLGPLFRSNEYSDSRKELLVFVSPRVVQIPGSEGS